MKSTDFYLKYEILQLDNIDIYYINIMTSYTISGNKILVDVSALWSSANILSMVKDCRFIVLHWDNYKSFTGLCVLAVISLSTSTRALIH